MSGALCEIAKHALARDFRQIDPAQTRVILLGGSERVFPPYTAKNILRARRGEPLLPFRYRNTGSLARVGRSAAVTDFGKLELSGPLAWLT